MKPNENEQQVEGEIVRDVTGDVIGDTAYSERFVLKILLKLANLDSLQVEIKDQSFEDDLCTLWDMTTERDVVLFLQKHKILNLLNFALPVVDTPRLIEIVVGIIGNMCCQKEVVEELIDTDSILLKLMEHIKSDDSLILIQIFRLISSCLYITEDATTWLDLFSKFEYSNSLYFILKNSSNKDLLITSLENFNTVCTVCNTENCRNSFFNQFITANALEALVGAFLEITVNQKDDCSKEEMERILVISLQIALNLIGFDKSVEIYSESKDMVTSMINHIFKYYEYKFVSQKDIDSDLVDIVESTITIINSLTIGCTSEVYFESSFKIWEVVKSLNTDKANASNFEDSCDIEEIQECSKQLVKPLSTLLCIHLNSCKENELRTLLEAIKGEFEEIVTFVEDSELKSNLLSKTAHYMNKTSNGVS